MQDIFFPLDGWDDVVDGGGRATEYPSMGVLKLRLPLTLLLACCASVFTSIGSDSDVGVTCTLYLSLSLSLSLFLSRPLQLAASPTRRIFVFLCNLNVRFSAALFYSANRAALSIGPLARTS